LVCSLFVAWCSLILWVVVWVVGCLVGLVGGGVRVMEEPVRCLCICACVMLRAHESSR
jgi:hypothetical protein